jgi:hypothetical protein
VWQFGSGCGCGSGSGSGCVAVGGADCFLNERDRSSIEGVTVGLDSWQCGGLAVAVAVAVGVAVAAWQCGEQTAF